MKPVLLFLLLAALILAACQPGAAQKASTVCLQSCDDILRQLTSATGVIDDAVLAARRADKLDDAGRLFTQSGDDLDDLQRIVRANVAGKTDDPFQLTDDILRTSSQASDHLHSLRTWAGDNQEGIEFFTNLACAYRDAYQKAYAKHQRVPTYAELSVEFVGRYSQAPPTAEDIIEPWNRLVGALDQNGINLWDGSITLYCVVTSVLPD